AAALVARARDLTARAAPPVCVMASGETTVTLPPEARGRGGRNQEFALAAALEFGAFADYAFARAGTDGIDRPPDAAGAGVDASTLVRAREKSLDAQRALQAHDTYPFFAALGDLI